MQFIKLDLGERVGGEIVEVEITAAAYVRLMDSANFDRYHYGQRHDSYGGYVTKSPFRISIPYPGRWIVVVDLAGYAGKVGASARVLSHDLQLAQERA